MVTGVDKVLQMVTRGYRGLQGVTGDDKGLQGVTRDYRAQLFEGRLALNPGLNLTLVSFSCVQKHFLG